MRPSGPPRRNTGARPGGRFPRSGPGGRGRPGGRPGFGPRHGGRMFQKKICRLCPEGSDVLNYRNVELIKRYLTEKGKILPRRITGNCAKCQRKVTRIIKRSRHAALVAFQIN